MEAFVDIDPVLRARLDNGTIDFIITEAAKALRKELIAKGIDPSQSTDHRVCVSFDQMAHTLIATFHCKVPDTTDNKIN